ncbi:MAG TPA: phasin family protein [Burkholderiales bacterium]
MNPVLQSRTNSAGKTRCSGLCDTSINHAATHKTLDFLRGRPRIEFAALHKTQQELQMYVTPEQIQAASKANVEALLAVANAQFAAFEKLANINAGAVKNAFEDSIANTRALLGAKDVQEFVTLQNAFAQPAIEKAIAYSKSVYEVATETNAELSKVAERRVAEWNENFVTLLDKVSKNAPAGSDVAVAAVKSMLAAANSAYDNLNKVAKQATEMAEANVAAATETVKGLAKAKKAA